MIFNISEDDEVFFEDVLRFVNKYELIILVGMANKYKCDDLILPAELDDIMDEKNVKRFFDLYIKNANLHLERKMKQDNKKRKSTK